MNVLHTPKPKTPRQALATIAAFVLLGAMTVPAGVAQAAPMIPGVTTGNAEAVSYSSATLTGSINPRGSDTSYYFQYGPTRAYGAQTGIADAGAGTGAVSVSLPVTGLQPLTRYHYRLVAVNSEGASNGADRTLMTQKVPLSLQILVSPNPVLFGGTITVQGTLSGTGNGGRPVVLQVSQFPFTAGFQTVGNAQLTSTTGGFSFAALGLTLASQFRVVATTSPPVISPVALESVSVRVSAHVARTRRRGYARIYGIVTPAANGMQVGIMRISHGRNVLVAGTVLRPRNASTSRFDRVVRVSRGAYRVLVRVTNGAQSSAYSTPLRIG